MRRTTTAAVVAVVLAASGCASGEGEGGESSSTSTAPPSVVPTEESPSTSSSGSESSGQSSTSSAGGNTEPPPEAQKNTKAGAEAFAKWYYLQAGAALVTGDASTFRKYSSTSCRVCQRTADETETGAKRDGLVQSNPYRASVLDSTKEGNSRRVRVKVNYDDYSFVREDGSKTTVEGNQYWITSTTTFNGDHWQVQDWVVVMTDETP
ncbi:hypothetical protein GCM10022199_16820 [Marihabitans asiaticum]|uniref:DUF6318 domain-containing protein n=1 Tax=Marihabitans asiaticum TaxID=415218 RepID=A0A560W7Z7_9MICO|nr:DUF6318 family protein [Marihabitans asiaticum]TWD13635.1 hypothetical protein FB557_2262 [Marihabitans asiaticum]